MGKVELNPCRYCGAKVTLLSRGVRERSIFYCDNCKTIISFAASTDAEAFAKYKKFSINVQDSEKGAGLEENQ